MSNNSSFFSLGSNTTSNTGGPGTLMQVLFGFVLVICVFMVFIFVEIIYKYLNRMSSNRVELLADTYVMDDKTKVILQNPNANGSQTIHLSDNERSGVEFSYSFYLQVSASAFRQEYGLMHIFHKGYSSQFPLLAPGVYMRSDTNTMRVYMNTYKTWNNYIEIENIPVDKWVHVVIVCKDKALEIFINGNLSKKMSFDGFAPYQNYQDICCFSSRQIHLKQAQIPSLDATGFDVFGNTKGMLSRLVYFNYALCYAEIQKLMAEGPSSKMASSMVANVPPYLADTWWQNGY